MYRGGGLVCTSVGGGIGVGRIVGGARREAGGGAERVVAAVRAGLGGELRGVGLGGPVGGGVHGARLVVGRGHVRGEFRRLRGRVGAAQQLLLLGLRVELGDGLVRLEELGEVRVHAGGGLRHQRLLLDPLSQLVLLQQAARVAGVQGRGDGGRAARVPRLRLDVLPRVRAGERQHQFVLEVRREEAVGVCVSRF